MNQFPILVTGASGQLGRCVLNILLQSNHRRIIAATRTPEHLSEFAAQGVEVRFADFDRPENLPAAFAGAKRMLVISSVPGDRVNQHRNAVKAAQESGVEHLVYTSFLDVSQSPLAFLAADHIATERMIEESGLGYTILRNSFYADMIGTKLAGAASSGRIFTLAGDGKIAYVTREDCALAAAAALTDGFQGKRILSITGPVANSAVELAQIASEALGVEIVVVVVTRDEFQRRLVSSGTPAPLAAMLTAIEAGVSEGVLDVQSGDFGQLTGRAAASIGDFISRNRAKFLAPLH